ncbi:hypothetical protein NE237_029532 [Protea cynaroides]|uniref:Serine protease inhibitor, Kazal-type family protein n=1 Tax=Protea cynaroides TaxID=273540 RepID=A0A9Q0JW59_9MAGN|nr:hypothetical protein NE237_029532 [Protea cynaroides]
MATLTGRSSPEAMPPFSTSIFLIFSFYLLFILLSLCSSPVRSQHDSSSSEIIRLSSEDARGDLCDGSSQRLACPVNCFRTDPVCGIDGVTYWCGCADALCAGTRVAKLGFCEVGNGARSPVSGQALLLVHIVWLVILGFSVLFGLL